MKEDDSLTPPEAIRKITAFLKEKNIDGHLKFEAEMMLSEVLNCNRLDIYMQYDILLTGQEKEMLRTLIRQRIKGNPLAHIIGSTFFYGKKFKCRPGVLIPRPDTEDLVIHALEMIRERRQKTGPFLDILEIGCGTGAVSLAIATEEKSLHFSLIDVSDTAIENTKVNISGFQNIIDNKGHSFDMFQHDILNDTLGEKSWDLIISNPPYVSESEYENFPKEVKQHEPKEAFWGGKDGLDFYRCFANTLHKHLKHDGYLIFECGYIQKTPILQIFKDAPGWKLYKTYRDINQKDRVMAFQPIAE